jgi:beta-lactamase class A
MLYNSEGKGSEQIISYMKEQTRVTKIPSVLPTDIEVAHKTGELEDTENDSAIIYGPDSDIVLVVCFSNLSDTLSGQTAIRMVADDVYKFWNRY